MTPELRHVRMFAVLAAASSLSNAARELGVTQPTASRMLREIETAVGVRLVTRGPHGAVLTARGEAFAQRCEDVLRGFDALVDPGRWEPWSVTVAYEWAGSDAAVSGAVRAWSTAHPDGACRLTQLAAPDVAVARGTADVAVVRGPVSAPGVRSRVLHREERAVVFSRDSVLSDVPRVAPGDIAGLHAVVNPHGGTTTAEWLAHIGPVEVVPVRGVDEWIVAIAADSRRFGITPASTMRYYNHPALEVRPSTGLEPVPVHLVWRDGECSPAVTEFVRLVQENA
ncbi:LysR family transcriptional regulator [Kocuria rhizophila]|uniref:LysR family transcriptional regulator n=1 Tax=Kocuria rhizophila TaxID=72000 RepID=UPI00073D3F3E|nr:LysR family transcriptional regulator [Kocuria rhizophila]